MNKFAKDIFIAALTAALTIIGGTIAWKTQFNDTNSQARYEHKLTFKEKYLKDATSMIYYLRFMDKVHLAIVKLEIKKISKPNVIDPFDDVEEKYKSVFTDLVTSKISKTVGKKDPSTYKLYQKANEFISQYFATYNSTATFFDRLTYIEMKKMDTLLTPQHYETYVRNRIRILNKPIDSIDDSDVDRDLLTERYNQLNKVISCLKTELQEKK